MNHFEALEHIGMEIASKIGLCPVEYPTEEHKKHLLRKAVIGHDWSKEVFSRPESEGASFHSLFSGLYVAEGAHEDDLVAIQKDKMHRAGSSNIREERHGDIYIPRAIKKGREKLISAL